MAEVDLATQQEICVFAGELVHGLIAVRIAAPFVGLTYPEDAPPVVRDVDSLRDFVHWMRARSTWVPGDGLCDTPTCSNHCDPKTLNPHTVVPSDIVLRGVLKNDSLTTFLPTLQVYWCAKCDKETIFRRGVKPYASTRRGRTGEMCWYAHWVLEQQGHVVRICMATFDAVWLEVKLGDRWVHADIWDTIVDDPDVYERNWKNLRPAHDLVVYTSLDDGVARVDLAVEHLHQIRRRPVTV